MSNPAGTPSSLRRFLIGRNGPRPLQGATEILRQAKAQTPYYAVEDPPRELKPIGRGLGHTPRAITALIIREMSTTYGRSPLGYLWAILEPVAGIMLLTVVFSLVFSTPPIGSNFSLFYASGLLPYVTYTDLSNKVAQSLQFSKALLFYPRVTFLDAILARLLLNALTQAMVMAVLFALIIHFYDVDVILDPPAMLLGFAMAVAVAFGIGMVNCYLFTFYPAWQFAWAVVNRPMMIISCVIFIFDSMPEPYRSWLWWNPLVHVVGQMRHGVYATYDADYVSPGYVFGVSGVLAVIGLMLLRRYHRDIVNV